MKIQIEKTKRGHKATIAAARQLQDRDLLRLTLPALTLTTFGKVGVRFIEAVLRQVRQGRTFEIEGRRAVFVEKGSKPWIVGWTGMAVEIARPPLGWHTTAAAIYSLVDAMAKGEKNKKRLYDALIMAEVLKDDDPDADSFDGHFFVKGIKVLLPPDTEPWATLEQAIEVVKKVRARVVSCDYCGAVIPGRERLRRHNFCSDLCRVRWHRQQAAAKRPKP